jgi:hypothetical protein
MSTSYSKDEKKSVVTGVASAPKSLEASIRWQKTLFLRYLFTVLYPVEFLPPTFGSLSSFLRYMDVYRVCELLHPFLMNDCICSTRLFLASQHVLLV